LYQRGLRVDGFADGNAWWGVPDHSTGDADCAAYDVRLNGNALNRMTDLGSDE
jgi:hypothetical protein